MSWTNFYYILSIVGSIASCVALLPIFVLWYRRITGKIQGIDEKEKAYLNSLKKDMDNRNHANSWNNDLYIPVTSELKEQEISARIQEHIRQSYYLVKTIHPSSSRQDFNTLSNIEKIDSSRGITFFSLSQAISRAEDNAVVVLASPGGGKTVSLRNLAIKDANDRLRRKTNRLPILINLGHYIGYSESGRIQEFADFLDEYFASSGYQSYFAGGVWRKLLQESKVVFYFDALDELPRLPGEYQQRCQAIEAFIRDWPNTPFVLACRELDYDYQMSFQQILIKPFDERQIRKYVYNSFPLFQAKSLWDNIGKNMAMFEICKNPFYLNLLCMYVRGMEHFPENRAQLFTFFIDRLIQRENEREAKLASPLLRQKFVQVISSLAYYMAVEQRVTTTDIGSYYKKFPNEDEQNIQREYVNVALNAGLLNEQGNIGQVRFSHHRFQEFFSSFVFISHLEDPEFEMPPGFYTNLWWTETILFIAGLVEEVDPFIERLLNARSQFPDCEDDPITRLYRLDLVLLTFRCILANIQFKNQALKQRVEEILFEEYNRGNPLERAKIVAALAMDRSQRVLAFLHRALEDKNNWVSESAFFAISSGDFQFHLTYLKLAKEFLRYFIEGRILWTAPSVFRAAQRSRRVRLLLPVFIALVGLSFVTLASIVIVLGYFVYFLLFKLNYALDSNCLSCLYTIALASFVICWFFIRTNAPILRRGLLTAPLAFLCYIFTFHGITNKDSILVRAGAWGTGIVFALLYRRLLSRRREQTLSIWTVTSLLFGVVIGLTILRIFIAPHPELGYQSTFDMNWIREPLKKRIAEELTQDITSQIEISNIWMEFEQDRDLKVAAQRVAREFSRWSPGPEVEIYLYPYKGGKKIIGKSIRNTTFAEFQRNKITGEEEFKFAVKAAIEESVEPIADKYSRAKFGYYLYLTVLGIMLIGISYMVIMQGVLLWRLRLNRKRIQNSIKKGSMEVEAISNILQEQPGGWARRLLVDYTVSTLVQSHGRATSDIVVFLTEVSEKLTEKDIQDSIFRHLEQVQRNFRRDPDSEIL